MNSRTNPIVIIGTGLAGYNLAKEIRKLDAECASLKDQKRKQACVNEIDEFYVTTARRGRVRNGAVYMPPFEGTLSQEAMWSIKAYLETRREKPL